MQLVMMYSRVKLPTKALILPKMEVEFFKQWNLRIWITET